MSSTIRFHKGGNLPIETWRNQSKWWRSRRQLLLMLGGLAAVMAMLTPAAQPALADHTTLDLLPSPLLLSPGDQDVLDVWVFGLDGPDRLTRYDLTLDYDPAVNIIDAVTGGNAPFDATPTSTIDNEIGRVTFSTNQTQGGAT